MNTPRSIGRLALVATLLTGGAAVAHAQLDPKFDPSKLQTPPLRRIQTVTPERFTLPNGIVVFLLESHDLPVISGTAYVRTTPAWIPNDKVGLGGVTGQVMRSGGTATHSGDWLDDRLGAIGASISSNISTDLATSGFNCLAENASEVIGLMAEIVRAPAFPDDKIELARVGLRRGIASRNDEMLPLLQRTASQAIYGKDSPYGREPEYATVEAIQREDCVALHGKVFEPSRTVLAVYGDFKSADMKKLLKDKFGAWKGSGAKLPALPSWSSSGTPSLMFAPKEDVTQSGLVVTHLGFRADDPDYPAMDVLQTALGGGFQSRLVNLIRTERGLAYATGAITGEDYQRPGVFLAYSLTKSESTMTALELLREEVRKVTVAPFTDTELKIAKESVLNQFVFNFEQPSSVLFRSAYYEAVGYPQDFLQKYQQGVEAVTAQSVLETAKRKIHPERMMVVVVGKEKDFERPLESAGLPVQRVDISIPPPASKVKAVAATPEALTNGSQWLAKAAELAGGSAAWREVKSIVLEDQRTLTMQGQTFNMTSSVQWVLPDRWVAVQKLPMGEMKQGFDGSAGWMTAMGQVQDQPKMADEVKKQYERSLFNLFGHPEKIQVQALAEPRTIDGVSYRVAVVKSESTRDWSLLFAPDGTLARMEYQDAGPMGPAQVTEVMADWKPLGSIRYPYKTTVLLDGKPFMDGTVTQAKFNQDIGAATFKKPSS